MFIRRAAWKSLIAGTLLALPAIAASRQDAEPGDFTVEQKTAREGPEQDDPRARMRAMRALNGEPDPAAAWTVLQEARRERDKWSSAVIPLRSAATTASLFVNLGPTFAQNDVNITVKYNEVDSGRARQILTHPTNPAILYMATSGGGVWKSYDGGSGWEPITDSLGTLAIGALAMDPSNPDILYLGFGDPFDVQQPGLVRSTDGGATWSTPQQLGTSDYGNPLTVQSVRAMQVDPQNSSNVLAATDAGLFCSSNAGNGFAHVMLSAPSGTAAYSDGWSVAWAGPNTWLFTAIGYDAKGNTIGFGVWRATGSNPCSAASWAWAASSLPADKISRATLAAAPSTTTDGSGSRIYLLAAALDGLSQYDLYRSDDGGQSWTGLAVNATRQPLNPNGDQTDLDVMHEQAWYNQALLVDPQDANTVFIGGNLAMVRSQDGGVSWAVLSDWLPKQGIARPYVHADFHAFAVGVGGTFYAGSDGGIFLSTNARTDPYSSVTFTSARNEGLVTHLAYTVACPQPGWPTGDASAQNFVAGGLQDNGTRMRTTGTTFDQIQGGDGIGLAASNTTATRPSDGVVGPGTFLVSAAPGDIFRSFDGGDTFTHFIAGISGSAGYAGFFVRLARDVADSAPDTFLTFSSPAAFYVSRAGANWSEVPATLHWPDGSAVTGWTTPTKTALGLRILDTHPSQANTYAMASNIYAYVTSDGGSNWTASARVSPYANPDTQGGSYRFNGIAFDPRDPSGNTYYLGSGAMDLLDANSGFHPLPASWGHLYKTTDRGAHWTSVGASSLPNVPIRVVRFDPANPANLYVGTDIGLYVSFNGGAFVRYGAGQSSANPLGLPLVEVTDLCFVPNSDRLVVATFGRGFWEIGTGLPGGIAGVRGGGDTNFDQVIDGRDLLDLADAYGSNSTKPTYRYQADLDGDLNIGDSDVTALLNKFGGTP